MNIKETVLEADIKPFTRGEKIVTAICFAFMIAVAIVVILGSAGCVYKGAKVIEGTDLAVGIDIPSAEGTAQLDVLNYLSGFRLGVAENAELSVKYTIAETNSYFGVIHTKTAKTIDATVTPLAVTNAAPCSCSCTNCPCTR